MSTGPAATHTLTLFGVLSESNRIINAHSRHFLALSVIFLLPLSFSLIIFPTLQLSLSKPLIISTQFLLLEDPQQPFTFTLPLLYSLFIYTLSLCATATITYSTLHGFYGRPVKFFPALKSLISSFLPLFLTTLAGLLILSLISLTFILFFTVVIRMGENLGFVINYTSYYVLLFCAVVGGTLILFIIYLLLNWSLACVVVVTESKYGFAPLWRSAYLVKGMKSVSVWSLVLFGGLVGIWVWVNVNDVLRVDAIGGGGGWRSWGFVLEVVTFTSVLSLCLLISVSANAVLYMYCKAVHGELAIEIAEEFASEYVSLPFDDEKVPHVVTVFHG